MNQQRSLTLNGLTGMHALHILNALCMAGVSLYLTTHYYDTLFPAAIGGGKSLCDISNFFNCDGATWSPIAAVMGVPTGFFGLIVSIVLLVSSILPSEAQEKTCSALTKYNFIGCIALFIYSLVVLGSLCPMCTTYYVLSGIAFALYLRKGINSWLPDIKPTLAWVVVLAAGSFFMSQHTKDKADSYSRLNNQIVDQFRALADLGDPDQDSPYVIHLAKGKTFRDSPLRLTVFSDFQCPFCKIVAEQVPALVRKYGDNLSVQYMFYPLDSSCNPAVKGRFHDNACAAATIAACDVAKFAEVHDVIFSKQDKLSPETLKEVADKFGLSGCLENQAAKDAVANSLNQGTKYNLKSTPTLILNGKKIEGSIPNSQFHAIFDGILQQK